MSVHEKHVPLTFALDANGVLRHVDDVANGLACSCLCRACASRLIAKHGNVRAHHFSHEDGTECAYGVETALHLAAKDLLVKAKRFSLPALTVARTVVDSGGRKHQAQGQLPARTIAFDTVESEVRLGRVVPDIVATSRGQTYLIEVAVTHFIKSEPEKLVAIAQMGLPTIEIDLSGIDDGWTLDTLRPAVLEATARKTWIFHPHEIDRKTQLNAAQALAENADNEETERRVVSRDIEQQFAGDAAQDEDERPERTQRVVTQLRDSTPGFLPAVNLLRRLLSPEGIAEELRLMDLEGPRTTAWQLHALSLGLRWETAHPHVDIQVHDELAWSVARRVWQAAVFGRFVQADTCSSFTDDAAARFCRDSIGLRPEFYILFNNKALLSYEERQCLPNPSHALQDYLLALEKLGYVAKTGRNTWHVLRRSLHSL